MAVLAQLYQLEQLDSKLEGMEAQLADLRRRFGRNPDLDTARAQLARLQSQKQEVDAAQRSLESDLSATEAKIQRDRTRMYSGQIADAHQLKSLERELEHLNGQRDEVELQLLEMMERRDALENELAEAQRRADTLQHEWETQRPQLSQQGKQVTAMVAQLRAQRESLAAELDPRSLGQYQRLRDASGHAVSFVSDGVCQWCRVGIPPKDVQHARSGAVVTCTNCARILFAG